MNRLAKTIFVAMMLLAIPMRQLAQHHNPPTIDFDITDISLFDERVFFLYNIMNDSRFEVIIGENDGAFVISASEAFDGIDLHDAFADFREQQALLFARMGKEEAAELASNYKAALPQNYTLSLMMDVYSRSRQNNLCANADPFCTDNGMYEFPAGVNAGSGETGPDYDCLSTQPNPAWYYMQIADPGDIDIYMYSTPSVDIDFCCWGPYDDPSSPCPNGLTGSMVVSCSYSAAPTEHCMIPASAQTGEYYILVITNYSNQTCNINFSKVDGSGTTNCGILPGIANNDGPYCVGDDIHLTVNPQLNATYEWSGPNEFSSTDQNPTIPNCTFEMAGIYSCTTIIGEQTATSTTEVVIYPQPIADFTFVSVCEGEPILFTSTSTTNPSGGEITQMWDFGDGQTGTGTNPSHLYDGAGEYEVTLTVTTEEGQCTDSKTQTVSVYAIPDVTATADPEEVPYGQSATLTATVATQGSFTYHWTPENEVTDPNSAITHTLPIREPMIFTVTVTNQQGDCVSTQLVSVGMEGSNLTAEVTADETELCQGESTTLHAIPHNGTGNYTYLWSGPNNFSSTEQHPTITPLVGTSQYTCFIADDLTMKSGEISITVYPEIMEADAIYDTPCDSVVFTWQGRDTVFYANAVHRFMGQTEHGCPHEQTIRITNMEYTPQPKIMSDDSLSHYPITATEFLVNQYTYYITDNVSNISHWNLDQCGWSISYPSWRIVESEDKLSCKVYPMDHTNDTVWLSFTAVNDCDSVTYNYFLVSSFYSIDDQDLIPISVSVIPNPNNGQMELRFDNMEGQIDVKVYSMAGTVVDHFEIETRQNPYHYQYAMKRLSDGVYFFVFNDGKHSLTKKVVIIH